MRCNRVRPEAITVLREISIDIPGQRSKPVSEIPAAVQGSDEERLAAFRFFLDQLVARHRRAEEMSRP